MKIPIKEGHAEVLADVKEISVSVRFNIVTIALSVSNEYEAQSLHDDISGLLKSGKTIALKNRTSKRVGVPNEG